MHAPPRPIIKLFMKTAGHPVLIIITGPTGITAAGRQGTIIPTVVIIALQMALPIETLAAGPRVVITRTEILTARQQWFLRQIHQVTVPPARMCPVPMVTLHL